MSDLPAFATLAGQRWRFDPCLICHGTGEIVWQHKGEFPKARKTNRRWCSDCSGRGYIRSLIYDDIRKVIA